MNLGKIGGDPFKPLKNQKNQIIYSIWSLKKHTQNLFIYFIMCANGAHHQNNIQLFLSIFDFLIKL
jgi:hypothetical protein